MSSPTFYRLKNAHGNVVAHQLTTRRSQIPLLKEFNREAFDQEAGQMLTLIINKLAEDSDGQSALAQAASLESPGGVVPRDEFHACLERYATSQERIISHAQSMVEDTPGKQERTARADNNIALVRKAQAALSGPTPSL